MKNPSKFFKKRQIEGLIMEGEAIVGVTFVVKHWKHTVRVGDRVQWYFIGASCLHTIACIAFRAGVLMCQCADTDIWFRVDECMRYEPDR